MSVTLDESYARCRELGFRLGRDGQSTELDRVTATHIFVDAG